MKKRVVSLLLCLIMALSLIPTAAFATEVADPAVETLSSDAAVPYAWEWTSDHIDIQMSLDIPGAGDINLDGNDMKALTITATQAGKSVQYTWDGSYELNGSTDKYGHKQVRLNGSFPIGTQNNPVEYTITLTKTVNGTPYTLTLTASYWKNNVCPGKGIDVAFGKGTSMPQVTITKKIEGIDEKDLVAGQKFTFEVKNAKGESVATLTATTAAGSNTAMAGTYLAPGTYTVDEIKQDPYDGYTFDQTSITSATLTVSKNGTNSITITNKYKTDAPETTSVTVTKEWVHKDVPAAMRPTAVNVTLMNGATAAGQVTLNAANQWTYTFNDLPKYDDAKNEITYTVKETPVPGYATTIASSVVDGFTITNTAQLGEEQINPASLIIYKFERDDIDKPLSGAEFTLTKQGETTGAVKTTDNVGFCTFDNLKEGVYTLTETKAPAGYNSTSDTWTIYVDKDTDTEKTVLDQATNTFVKHYDCMVSVQLNDDEESYLLDENVALSISNEKVPEPVTLKNLKVTKNVKKALDSLNPDSADFTFKACYTNANNELVEFTKNTLTIHTTGDKTSYTENWELTIPAEAFCHDDYSVNYAELVISEVNGNLSGWDYDKKVYTLYVLPDGTVYNGGLPHVLTPEKKEVPSLNLTFTNEYNYTYTPVTPPITPIRRQPTTTTKPVQSVKTGDMGIALYAVTSLLSLGGTALVIKKRKDEE